MSTRSIHPNTASEIRQLSSGTIATISGFTTYTEIDLWREAFARWVEMQPRAFTTWMRALVAYRQTDTREIPPGKHIERTIDGDYAAFYDGMFVGFRPSHIEAKTLLDQHAYRELAA